MRCRTTSPWGERRRCVRPGSTSVIRVRSQASGHHTRILVVVMAANVTFRHTRVVASDGDREHPPGVPFRTALRNPASRTTERQRRRWIDRHPVVVLRENTSTSSMAFDPAKSLPASPATRPAWNRSSRPLPRRALCDAVGAGRGMAVARRRPPIATAPRLTPAPLNRSADDTLTQSPARRHGGAQIVRGCRCERVAPGWHIVSWLAGTHRVCADQIAVLEE
jgi:hypothetical protein